MDITAFPVDKAASGRCGYDGSSNDFLLGSWKEARTNEKGILRLSSTKKKKREKKQTKLPFDIVARSPSTNKKVVRTVHSVHTVPKTLKSLAPVDRRMDSEWNRIVMSELARWRCQNVSGVFSSRTSDHPWPRLIFFDGFHFPIPVRVVLGI